MIQFLQTGKTPINRALGSLFVSFILIGCSNPTTDAPASNTFQSAWPADVQRDWAGPEYWANRLQDWHIENGRLVCNEDAEDLPLRTVHLLTHRLGSSDGTLQMQVRTGLVEGADPMADGSLVGFLIGAGNGIDYRSAALIHNSPGPGGGLLVGIDGKGAAFVQDLGLGEHIATVPAPGTRTPSDLILDVSLAPLDSLYALTFSVTDAGSNAAVATITVNDLRAEQLIGNLALAASRTQRWFEDWTASGSKVEHHEDDTAGPILAAQHTLSGGIMKLTAQLMPVGEADNQTVRLETRSGSSWQTVATTDIIIPGFTAAFRVPDWDDTQDVPYRVAYNLKQADGTDRTYTWSGTIRKDPLDQDIISVAGFTGNHNMASGGAERDIVQWHQYVWFPHTDIVESVQNNNVDVLFFSGDQVYEGASPTRPDREQAYLDYLYKWYLWAWAFRDLTRDRPTITIPDDHDVFQGNIWGAGGPPTDKDDKGGYVMPADWVKMVERTQTSHLPDPYDPTPIQQGIGVYYTDMTYGRIGIAILEDRKFKSGCAGIIPNKEGRADHITDPNFDMASLDLPDLKLLGDRQLVFLEDWAADWGGQDMKLAVSQTVFANMATHHGANLQRLYGDLDSNGWPQSGRNRALHELRRGFAVMLQGDQHLSTLVHHGIDTHNDAGYSFCVPSIANFYPRGWDPGVPGANRPEGAPDYMGEHYDGFGHPVTVYGVTNPTSLTGVSTNQEPLELHDKMPGYGIIRFNKTDRTITMENWPRYVDPTDPSTGTQYPGWPRTISMEENYGREAVAYLPTLNIEGMTDPVVQIIDEEADEIVYTLRINGTTFRPKVFGTGVYTVRVGAPEDDNMQTLRGIPAQTAEESDTLTVSF